MPVTDFRRPTNPFATRWIRPGAIPYLSLHSGSHQQSLTTDLLAEHQTAALRNLAQKMARVRQGAITGVHGSGKSTLIASLRPYLKEHFGAITHLTWASDLFHSRRNLLRDIFRQRDQLCIIDGFEQIGAIRGTLLAITAGVLDTPILVTNHRPIRCLPTLWQTNIDYHLARYLTTQRMHTWPQYLRPIMDSFETRWRSSTGNLRELWFQLYDDFELLYRNKETLPYDSPKYDYSVQVYAP